MREQRHALTAPSLRRRAWCRSVPWRRAEPLLRRAMTVPRCCAGQCDERRRGRVRARAFEEWKGAGEGRLSADDGLVLLLGGRDDHRMPLRPQLQPSAATAGRCAAPPRHATPCDSCYRGRAIRHGRADSAAWEAQRESPADAVGTAHTTALGGTRGTRGPDLLLLLCAERLEPANVRSVSRLGRASAVHRRKTLSHKAESSQAHPKQNPPHA